MSATRYYVRFKFKSGMDCIRDVRLSGWKAEGTRAWLPFGAATPKELMDHLGACRATREGSGWGITAKMTPEQTRQILRGASKGGVYLTPPLEDDVRGIEDVFTPSYLKSTLGTISRLRRTHEQYCDKPLPPMFRLPEPQDFFTQVVIPTQLFEVPWKDGDAWRLTEYFRAADTEPVWKVDINGPTDSWLGWDGSVDGQEKWERVRPLISFAWNRSLGKLWYGNYCLATGTEPLGLYPRFSGGKVTNQTMLHVLQGTKAAAKELWHFEHQTKEAWELY